MRVLRINQFSGDVDAQDEQWLLHVALVKSEYFRKLGKPDTKLG